MVLEIQDSLGKVFHRLRAGDQGQHHDHYILPPLSLEVYRAATLDQTFTQDGSLVLEIDKTHHYPHSAHTLAKALLDNWAASPFCLYPCEPNWIYSFCNLYGINALTAYGTNEGTDHVSEVIARFRKGFKEEFMDPDGSSVTIKSSLTGFVIPGLIGVTNGLMYSTFTACAMPDVSRLSYTIAKEEYLALNEKGELSGLSKLQGADKIDPGWYVSSLITFYGGALSAARSFGDKLIADAVEKLVKEDKILKWTEDEGVAKWNGASVLMNNQLLRAKMMFRDGWKRFVSEPMPQHLKDGPILGDAKYPEVLVAKARLHDGYDLELVLYPGTEMTEVELGIKQFILEKVYNVTAGEGKQFEADKKGKAIIKINLHGRTKIWLKPL